MSILLLEAINIEKYFADTKVLDIKNFKVYTGDRIGLVGANGSGKTTFMNILAGELPPDDGIINRYCDISYIRQFGHKAEYDADNMHKLGQYGVLDIAGNPAVSGGEATRIKIAHAFSGSHRLIFADEPTANLDIYGVKQFSDELTSLESFIFISHDRALLNRHCNRIITIKNADIVVYEGNYDAYQEQSVARRERAVFEYGQYKSEKDRLQRVYTDKKAKAGKAAKKPKGMSSSEAKMRGFIATSRSFDGRTRRLNQAATAVQSRMDNLEVKERPADVPVMKLDFSLTDPPRNKIVLSAQGLSFAYGNRVLLSGAAFEVKNGARIALLGQNGSGKTTLLNLISQGNEAIYRVPKLRTGYFHQGFEQLNLNKTVLQNAAEDSLQSQTVVRSVLARMLFTDKDIGKPAGVLSGGERVKLSLVRLLLSRCNCLLLDEPTNFLDMPSLEVLQSILQEYEGTVLFVSHDRAFINAICTGLIIIKDRKLLAFEGSLDDYDNHGKRKAGQEQLLQKHRLAALAGEIAKARPEEKTALEARYMEMLRSD